MNAELFQNKKKKKTKTEEKISACLSILNE